MQFCQRLLVDVALEFDDRFERHPVIMPAPCIEFGLFVGAQLYVTVAGGHAKQEPDLLLAAIGATPVAAHPLVGNFVAQPLARATEDAHMIGLEPGLFFELAKHRLLGRLAVLDPALWKLPGMLVNALAPEHLVAGVAKDDADVGAVPIFIEHPDTAIS